MSIRKLLVPMLDCPEDAEAILHAVAIARDIGAHVTVLYAGGHLSELVSAEPPRYGRVKPQLQVEVRALLAEQAEAQQRAVSFASRSTSLSDVRYRNGYVSQLDLLDAQRSELRNRRQEVQIRSAQYQATVALVRALGGGWDIN